MWNLISDFCVILYIRSFKQTANIIFECFFPIIVCIVLLLSPSTNLENPFRKTIFTNLLFCSVSDISVNFLMLYLSIFSGRLDFIYNKWNQPVVTNICLVLINVQFPEWGLICRCRLAVAGSLPWLFGVVKAFLAAPCSYPGFGNM